MPDPPARRALLAAARRAVEAAVAAFAPPPVREAGPAGAHGWGAFVTLRHQGRLRGCRGVLSSDAPLEDLVARVAVLSALDDPRFPPVSPDEVAGLSYEISLLKDRRRLDDPSRLRVGLDGVLLTHRGRHGFLLPQVAHDHGDDAPTFLDRVCTKAGLPAGAWREPGARVEAFEVEHFGEADAPG